MTAFTWATRDFFLDDAYIGFRYVEHFLNGDGFVFNVGELVEGVTNIGWLLALIPFGLIAPLPLAAKALGFVAALATLAVATAVARRAAASPYESACVSVVPVFIATQLEWSFFSLAGMETALLSLCLCLQAWLADSSRHRYVVAGLAAYAFLLHPECLLIYPLMLVLARRDQHWTWRREAGPLLLWGTFLIGVTLVRLAYFGDPLPNTFYAKPSTTAPVLARLLTTLFGENANIAAPFRSPAALALILAGAFPLLRAGRRGGAVVLASTLVGFAFCAYSAPDWTLTGRYFAPYVPLAFVLLWKGIVTLHDWVRSWKAESFEYTAYGKEAAAPRPARAASPAPPVLGGLSLVSRPGWSWRGVHRDGSASPSPWRAVAARLCLVAFAAAILGINLHAAYAALNPQAVERYPGIVLTSKNLIGPSQWVRHHLPDDAVVATRRIGALAYYSNRAVFDYKFGLTNRDVARARFHGGKRKPFDDPHDPALAAIWQQVSPTHILEDLEVVDRIATETGGTRDHFVVHGMPYRLVRTFPIGEQIEWALCERTPAEGAVSEPRP